MGIVLTIHPLRVTRPVGRPHRHRARGGKGEALGEDGAADRIQTPPPGHAFIVARQSQGLVVPASGIDSVDRRDAGLLLHIKNVAAIGRPGRAAVVGRAVAAHPGDLLRACTLGQDPKMRMPTGGGGLRDHRRDCVAVRRKRYLLDRAAHRDPVIHLRGRLRRDALRGEQQQDQEPAKDLGHFGKLLLPKNVAIHRLCIYITLG